MRGKRYPSRVSSPTGGEGSLSSVAGGRHACNCHVWSPRKEDESSQAFGAEMGPTACRCDACKRAVDGMGVEKTSGASIPFFASFQVNSGRAKTATDLFSPDRRSW